MRAIPGQWSPWCHQSTYGALAFFFRSSSKSQYGPHWLIIANCEKSLLCNLNCFTLMLVGWIFPSCSNRDLKKRESWPANPKFKTNMSHQRKILKTFSGLMVLLSYLNCTGLILTGNSVLQQQIIPWKQMYQKIQWELQCFWFTKSTTISQVTCQYWRFVSAYHFKYSVMKVWDCYDMLHIIHHQKIRILCQPIFVYLLKQLLCPLLSSVIVVKTG